MKNTMRFAAAAASILLAMASVACSSDDDDKPNPPANNGGNDAGQSDQDSGTPEEDGSTPDDASAPEDDGSAPDGETGDNDPCTVCVVTTCAAEVDACEENSACNSALDEVGGCLDEKNLDDCLDQLVTGAGDEGEDAANALVVCLSANCADECGAEKP